MSNKKILIVDDDLVSVDILSIRLKKNAFDVITATEGLEALDKVYQEFPDLIILALVLPVLDGFHVCRLLKFDERYENIPIIATSVRAKEKEVKLAFEAGANQHIPKPFDPDSVINIVTKLLSS